MNRPSLNFLIDAIAFAAFAFLTTTGILTRYVLPPGSGRYATLWGLDRHGWGDIHFWVAVALLGVLALHLVLHWRWILCVVRGQRSEASGTRVGLGVIGLVGLLGLAVAPLLAPLEHAGEPRQAARRSPDLAPQPQAPAQTLPSALVPKEAPLGPVAQEPTVNTVPDAEAPGIEAIRGSMTLREVAASTGVPLNHLVAQLRLPSGVDPDERIGRLRKHYAISPDDVRRVVKEYGATH